MKLISSLFIFSLLASTIAFASAEQKLEQLRDISILARLPESVCKSSAHLRIAISAQTHMIYDQLISEFKHAPKAFLQRAKNCKADCTCAIYSDLENLFSGKDKDLLKQLKEQASAMNDRQYEACQAKLKLNCESKNIKPILKEVQSSSLEPHS